MDLTAGSPLGMLHSEETKQKIRGAGRARAAMAGRAKPIGSARYACSASDALLGEKNPQYGLKGEKSPNFGKTPPPEGDP